MYLEMIENEFTTAEKVFLKIMSIWFLLSIVDIICCAFLQIADINPFWNRVGDFMLLIGPWMYFPWVAVVVIIVIVLIIKS